VLRRPGSRLRLSRTLFVTLLLFSLVPVGIAAVFAITLLDSVVRKQTETSLRVAANLTQAAVMQFLDSLKNRTLEVADDWYIKLSLAGNRGVADVDRYLDVKRSHFPESDELFILDRTGRVVASSDGSSVGRDDSGTDYARAGAERLYLGDLVNDGDGHVRWIIAAPIIDRQSGSRLGVLANSVNKRTLSDLTTGRKLREFGIPDDALRRGQTGEVYLVDRDGFLITESRFIDRAVFRTKVDTPPVRRTASQRDRPLGEYRDYRGVPVTGASALVPGVGWLVLAEIDASEAIWPVRHLQLGLALLGVGLLPAVAILAFMIHDSTLRPIRKILAADERVGAVGPLGGLLAPEDFRYVEWRRLAVGRNTMLHQVREQTDRLRQQLDTERLYREAQEADRRKGIFLGTLAHELRNPLSAITGAAHALNVLAPDDAKRPTLRKIINDQVRQIARIVDELFDVSSATAGKLALRLRPVALVEVLRQVIDGLEAADRAQTGQIVSVGPDQPLIVMADPPRLAQVFRNLLDNAIKYSPPGTPVHVSVAREDDDAVVRIVDHGIGIAAEDHPYIFEPYRQSSAAVRQGGGLGLGLALVRNLVEQHQGRVTATSAGVGAGSEFVVRLPLAGPEPA